MIPSVYDKKFKLSKQDYHKYFPSKKYEYLLKRLEKMRNCVENIKYRNYLQKVEQLNQKKAYLSSYRNILTRE